MKEYHLTEGNILKTLLRFAVPFLAAALLQSLYGAADLFVVGTYCSAESVAAVSTGTQVTQIITSLITGLTLGSTILIGQYTGSRETETVKRIIGTTFVVFGITAAVLTVVLLAFEQPLLVLLQTPEESFVLTMRYVAICLWGNIFVCGYNAVSAVLRGYGDSVRPMVFIGISCLINIGLDIWFVRDLGLDSSGTALATILSQAVSMGIAVGYLKKKKFIFDFKWSSFRLDSDIVKKLLRIGIPISFQELMVRISFLYLMTVMNRCGVYAAAVVGIGSKYDVFAMLSATSMANALSALTAHNLGAGKPERAKRYANLAVMLGAAVMTCTGGLMFLGAPLMFSMLTPDAAIRELGVRVLRIEAFAEPLFAVSIVTAGALRGAGDTLIPSMINLASMWGVRITAASASG